MRFGEKLACLVRVISPESASYPSPVSLFIRRGRVWSPGSPSKHILIFSNSFMNLLPWLISFIGFPEKSCPYFLVKSSWRPLSTVVPPHIAPVFFLANKQDTRLTQTLTATRTDFVQLKGRHGLDFIRNKILDWSFVILIASYAGTPAFLTTVPPPMSTTMTFLFACMAWPKVISNVSWILFAIR